MISLLIIAATTAELPVERHTGIWSSPPRLTPGTGGVVDGPLLGNGDLGVTGSGTDAGSPTVQLWLGKNDFWADAVNYRWGWVYQHLSSGLVELSLVPSPSPSPSPSCLKDSEGHWTNASASWSGDGMSGPLGAYGVNASWSTPLGVLFTDTFYGNGDGLFSISDVPYARYDVVVYYRMNNEHSFNISGCSQPPVTVRPDVVNASSQFRAAPYPSPSNYAILSGCATSNLHLHFTTGGAQKFHRKSLAAVQVVDRGGSNRSIGINLVGMRAAHSSHDSGPGDPLPSDVVTGVIPQRHWVNLRTPGCGSSTDHGFRASQRLYEAKIAVQSGSLQTESIIAANENTVVTNVTYNHSSFALSPPDPASLSVTIVLNDFWKLPKSVGAETTQLWARHENNYASANPMVLGTCDPNAVFVRGIARFSVINSTLVVANGTRQECPGMQHPGAPVPPWAEAGIFLPVVRKSCADPTAAWIVERGSTTDAVMIRSQYNTSLCLGLSPHRSAVAGSLGAIVYSVPCAIATRWTLRNFSASSVSRFGEEFQLQAEGQCLVSVAGNTNNTLALAVEIRDGSGKALLLKDITSNGRTSVSALVDIAAGDTLTVLTAATTRRDLGGSDSADVVAASRGQASQADSQSLTGEHSEWWKAFWNVSSIDLGPKRQLLESWWYGMQYLLGSSSRRHKVVPSLWGPWSIHDPPDWADDITLDYNIEANFWSVGSSNRLELMEPYFATIYSLFDESRARAARPDWSVPGQIAKPTLGVNTQGEECGNFANSGHQESSDGCPKGFGNFSGLAVTNGMGPFAFQRLFHDDSCRFNAALAATPIIDYWRYSRNESFLRNGAYKWVKATAEFYASYAVLNERTGRHDIPYACAQEGCVLRQNQATACVQPQQTKNTALDLSLARLVLRTAASWAKILSVDEEVAQEWTRLADTLAEYPTTTDPISKHQVFSQSVDMHSNESICFGSNYDEPLLTLAAVFPGSQVSRRSHGAPVTPEEAGLWNIANATVWALSTFQERFGRSGAFAPLNGLCMHWPAAARVIGRGDTTALLDGFESALNRTMEKNFWPNLGGGGIEQAGASGSINDMLLASHNGYLEFFPLWPVGSPARFNSLRAQGAFVCSCLMDTQGVVGPATVTAEVGGEMQFVVPKGAPDGRPTVTETVTGAIVPVASRPGGVWSVMTRPDTTYKIEW